MTFREYHQQDTPLVICNVWDAKSAQTAEKMNFQAIATSSSALANSLGYEDGENISFEDLAFVVKHIVRSTSLPVSVDLEGGYSRDPHEIADHISQLAELGVVGINFEDSVITDSRNQLPAEAFAHTLEAVSTQLTKDQVEIFINLRTDAFLLKNPDATEESIRRIRIYETVGADGIFVPCITKTEDITAVVASTSLPVNVMAFPGLPDFQTLTTLGVRRVSMGGFLFHDLYNQYEKMLESVLSDQNFTSIF